MAPDFRRWARSAQRQNESDVSYQGGNFENFEALKIRSVSENEKENGNIDSTEEEYKYDRQVLEDIIPKLPDGDERVDKRMRRGDRRTSNC